MSNSFDVLYNSSGISTDTRKINANCLFICIKGDNFNGNTFAEKALEHGASHVIVDDKAFYKENTHMTYVESSVLYLHELAHFHRMKFDIPIIGITGSNGKTTTKELVHKVLSEQYNVLATIGNLNNHLGVPFTLLRLTAEHEIAIIEMGANKPRDIEELCRIASPTHGIITNIGRAHLEGFKDLEGVIQTKKELYDSIEKNNGVLFINADDRILNKIYPITTTSYSYGTTDTGNIVGELTDLSPFVEMKWSSNSYHSPTLKLKMVGKYNFYNYLAATAIGHFFKISNESISKALIDYTSENKRSQVKETASNTLILDCYNANPTSMESALDSFAMNTNTNKICILGDMKELGPESAEEHQKIITLLETLNLQAHVVGEEFSKLSSSALLKKFITVEELLKFIALFPIHEKLILIKGSNSIGLSRLEGSL